MQKPKRRWQEFCKEVRADVLTAISNPFSPLPLLKICVREIDRLISSEIEKVNDDGNRDSPKSK
jgi:hypothetical protein